MILSLPWIWNANLTVKYVEECHLACPRLLFLPLADAGYCDACVWILRSYYLKEQFSRETLQSSNGGEEVEGREPADAAEGWA